MKSTHTEVRCSSRLRIEAVSGLFLAALLVVGAGGCGPAEPSSLDPSSFLELEAREQGLSNSNGIITNGIITNGIITNGIITNGLTDLGLATGEFSAWFEKNPAAAAEMMRYLLQCALPAGQVRTHLSLSSGLHVWSGMLGLAPDWANGVPASVKEQQLVTACLAARANKYGVHVQVSLRGWDARGQALPLTNVEVNTYTEREAAFFGNIFTGEGLYACRDRNVLEAHESSPRACALPSHPGDAGCNPIVHLGACENHCKHNGGKAEIATCTYNGQRYSVLTTRINPADIYKCGDGVCQFTERCGTGSTSDSCRADCGACQ